MKFKLMNLNSDFKMGSFIDCETYIRNKDMMSVVSLIYRDMETNVVPVLNDLDYNYLIGAYNYYMEWRNGLFEHYIELFGDPDDYDKKKRLYKKLGSEYLDDTEDADQKQKNEWNRQWGWYSTLFETFCNGDYFKMKEAYNMGVVACFNHLTYLNNKKKSK